MDNGGKHVYLQSVLNLLKLVHTTKPGVNTCQPHFVNIIYYLNFEHWGKPFEK